MLVASKSRIVPAKKKFTIPKIGIIGKFYLIEFNKSIYKIYLKNDLLNKMYVYENGDSLDENNL